MNYTNTRISEAVRKARNNDKCIYVVPTAYGLLLDFRRPRLNDFFYARPNGEVVKVTRDLQTGHVVESTLTPKIIPA
jgi:hypothetical protein